MGQEFRAYTAALSADYRPLPRTTLTTGNRGKLKEPFVAGDRFGDPHAMVNRTNSVQICAFVAITDSMAAKHQDALRLLGAAEPTFSH